MQFIVYFTGAIQVNKALDRETKDSYALIVKAKDSGSPSRFATASVTIRITDVNDNKPKFNENPFTFRLAENAASQTQIGQITATDKDIGVNADLEFKSLTTGSPITVEPNGIVKVSGKLDYEATKKYTLNVQVSDRGNPKLTDTSTIIVEVRATCPHSGNYLYVLYVFKINLKSILRMLKIKHQNID